MNKASSGGLLTAVFVDYDNIYLSLKRRNEEAAKRFAKETHSWIRALESGSLITPTNKMVDDIDRRLVMNRCYGNPVPRRNGRDNSTDMHSFPFVRHNFLKAGFEIADCPPLTAQLKNSSDIRMVMDIRDFLEHETYFDEFIILSSDADFTPVLHRLRAHARRTVIFANDYTAAPYTALCDGEIREADLISFLMEGKLPQQSPLAITGETSDQADQKLIRDKILEEVVLAVSESQRPVPIAFLADRAQRKLGHDDTVGSNWAGYGAFRTFLIENLPDHVALSDQPPYFAYDPKRHSLPAPSMMPTQLAPPVATQPAQVPEPQQINNLPVPEPSDLQKAIARIHEACKAPALAPADYRLLFEVMAQEITERGILGAQTISNIIERAAGARLDVKREDVEFVIEVVSERDRYFEQGSSAGLFAGRFRNFVVDRCRAAGLSLAVDELDLIDAWFAAGFAVQQNGGNNATQAINQSLSGTGQQPQPAPAAQQQSAALRAAHAAAAAVDPSIAAQQPAADAQATANQRWWEANETTSAGAAAPQAQHPQAAAMQTTTTTAPAGYGAEQPVEQQVAMGGGGGIPTNTPTSPDDLSQLPRIIRQQSR